MKHYLVIPVIAFVLIGGSALGTDDLHPFDDALNILEDGRNIEPYLQRYVDADDDVQNVQDLLDRNIFLRKALPDVHIDDSGKVKFELSRIDPEGEPAPQSAGAEKLSIVSPTTAIDALGTFVARRFKEELNIAYLNKFKRKLEDDTTGLRILLPSTYLVLLRTDPYNYTSFIGTLRGAFDDDLQNIVKNLQELMKKHREDIKAKFVSDNTAFPKMMLFFTAVNSVYDSKQAAEVISDLATSRSVQELKDADKTSVVPDALKLLKYVTEEFTVIGSYEWIKSDDLKQLNDADTRNLFIGLFLEKYRKQLSELSDFPVSKVWEHNGSKELNQIRSYFEKTRHLISLAKRESKVITDLWRQHGKTSHQAFNEYARSLLILIKQGVEMHSDFTEDKKMLLSDELVKSADQLIAISSCVAEKDYGRVLVKSLEFFEMAWPVTDSTSAFKKRFIKYGSFAVNVATARSKEEVVQAIEAAALPVGSYRIKRNSDFNISINAFMGGFIASEDLILGNNTSGYVGYEKYTSFGFTAPIGLALSTDRSFKVIPGGWSKSLFISVIDIGAVAAFRLQDETSDLPETEFKNVLAPGGYFVVGIGGSPLSVGVGAQYGPQLRKIDLVNGNQIDSPSWRWGLFLAVDIPIFDLHTVVGSDN